MAGSRACRGTFDGRPSRASVPHWQGWPDVETITIWDEQGFGDTIQESRWLTALLKQATSVTLAVRAPLVRLMREGLSGLGPQLKVVDRAECAWIGCHGSLLSLRWRLQSSLSPADPGPAQGGCVYLNLLARSVWATHRPDLGCWSLQRVGLSAARSHEEIASHRDVAGSGQGPAG